ncbi:hypothetical protein [Alkalihalobacillus sp. BA299]|uniref:hypothetical protein n=1 Tax=Alkalihalobacillus sp. BA299 TaxID=2815938 RepID=UPI001ADCFFFA|nr:hypothetical protein [Alkalihalobacillus sp. BA299]
MSIFINNKDHPDVFKNNNKINAPNQGFIQYHSFAKLLNEQQEANKELTQSITDLKTHYEKLANTQSSQWNLLKHQITDMNDRNRHHKEFENHILQKLTTLNENNINLQTNIAKDILLKKSIIDEFHILKESNQEISGRLEKNEAATQQISSQVNEQQELQKEVVEKISNQEAFQAGVIKRLDNQEALTEKISRQLTHLRSIVFERTNDLATKIEDVYKLTSSYAYKLMTGSDQPLTFSLMKDKKKEQPKQPESSVPK